MFPPLHSPFIFTSSTFPFFHFIMLQCPQHFLTLTSSSFLAFFFFLFSFFFFLFWRLIAMLKTIQTAPLLECPYSRYLRYYIQYNSIVLYVTNTNQMKSIIIKIIKNISIIIIINIILVTTIIIIILSLLWGSYCIKFENKKMLRKLNTL